MRQALAATAALGLWIVGGVADLRAEITPEQVRAAIDHGVRFLKSQQRRDGSWNEFTGQPGGVTALCTLALLNSGVPADDEHVRRALRNLEQYSRPTKTYATALQTMVFCRANPKQYLAQIDVNVRWLESKQITTGPNRGAWGYPEGSGDNSNAQFAMLALHEAELVGVVVQPGTWARAKAYWEDAQNLDGSWGYQRSGLSGSTGSMTCAGVGSLIIAAGKMRPPDAQVTDDGRILCCRRAAEDDARIQRGLHWLGRNFSVTRNPGAPADLWLLYYLYGIERIGRLSGQRFFVDPQRGAHDWYREGAEHLVRRQDNLSGFWRGTGHVERNELIGTSLALLFLSKGRRPILMTKLKHSLDEDWNQHRSDVDHLTRDIEARWKMDLTWQVTDLRAASVEDLLESPVLFLSGNLSPLPTDAAQRQQLVRKLRDYLDRGGFLLAEGQCSALSFDQGFRQLMAEVFPEPEYALRLLEPQHPIWRAEAPLPPEHARPLLGIEFGCRTSVVYAPPDPPGAPRPSLSCLWELSRPERGKTYPRAVQEQIDAALILGANILAYATNREFRGREESFRVAVERGPADRLDRGRLYVAKIRHPGGCNAAPRALATLLETAAEKLQVRTAASAEMIDLAGDALFDYHLVFMHGRHAFRLTDAERQRLRTFLERGGMLLADSICANSAFTESFRRELAAVFPEIPREPIPADDPIWTTAYGGFDLKTVTRRDPQPAGTTGPLRATMRQVPPELEGIRLGGRWAVVFSPYDISCALEKHESLECQGYTRADAARIGLNVVLYSLHE
jgi:hypothetical protein